MSVQEILRGKNHVSTYPGYVNVESVRGVWRIFQGSVKSVHTLAPLLSMFVNTVGRRRTLVKVRS